MKRICEHVWPILFITLVWFLFASPYFIKGRIPYPSTYQANFFPPWSSYHIYDGPVKNAAMPDVIDQIYPWKHFTIESLKEGFIPFWNPYSFSGTIHVANYQSAVFSPFNILFFIFPFIDAWSLLILLQPLLAGIFMYMFIQSVQTESLNMNREIRDIGCLLSSVGFMFCGFITVWMDYGTLGYAILFLPLALFAIEMFFQIRHRWYLILLSFTIPLSFFSGHFQISLYFLATTVAYILYRGMTSGNAKKNIKGPMDGLLFRPRIVVVLLLIVSIVFGLCMIMSQVLPSLYAYGQSLRSNIFRVEEVIPWTYIPTFIAPDFFGHPVTRNDWYGHYAEWNAYIGLLPLMLAVYCIIRRRSKIVFFFIAVSIISFLLAFPSPLLSFVILLRIPVLSTSAASRIIILFSFSMLVLASLGFSEMIQDIQEKKFKYLWSMLIGFSVLFTILWSIVFSKIFLPPDKIIIAKQNLIIPSGFFLLIFFIFLSLFVLLSWSKENTKKRNIIVVSIMFALLLITTVDMVRFVTKWQAFDPRNLVFSQTPVITFLQHTVGSDERIIGNFGADVCVYYRLACVDGYDTLYIKRYGEFVAYVDHGLVGESFRSVVSFPKNGLYTANAINLLGVRYIVHKVSDGYVAWTFPFWLYPSGQFQLVYEDHAYQVYKNTKAFPKAFLVDTYVVKNQKESILSTMFNPSFDLRHQIVLEQDPKISTKADTTGTLHINNYSPDTIMIRTNTSSPKLLFLSDNNYPRWEAFIDGKQTKILRADYTFRAIVVPSGKHRVAFIYRPYSFRWGIFLEIGGIIGIMILCITWPYKR